MGAQCSFLFYSSLMLAWQYQKIAISWTFSQPSQVKITTSLEHYGIFLLFIQSDHFYPIAMHLFIFCNKHYLLLFIIFKHSPTILYIWLAFCPPLPSVPHFEDLPSFWKSVSALLEPIHFPSCIANIRKPLFLATHMHLWKPSALLVVAFIRTASFPCREGRGMVPFFVPTLLLKHPPALKVGLKFSNL